MNNELILSKIDEIIKYIEKSDNYQKYLKLKELMQNNPKIKDLQDEIRSLNKMIANNSDNKENLEKAINNREKLLMKEPLYREYINIVDELNNTFNIIENLINKYIENKVN